MSPIGDLQKAVSRLLNEQVIPLERLSYEGGTFLVQRVARPDGTTVVAKWTRAPRGPLVAERAALERISETAAANLVPHVIAGDENATLLVMTDLACTNAERLGTILEGRDPDAAEEGLLAHVRSLAALHVATAGVPAIEMAGRIAASEPYTRSRHAVNHVNKRLETLPERLEEALGSAVDIADDMEAARAALRDPGPFLAISHGDGTAANSFVRNGRALLIDFETAAARHALIDGAFARQRYLFSVWAKAIPDSVRQRAMTAYRDAVIEGLPNVDRQSYDSGEAAACAAWTSIILGRLPSAAGADVRFGRTGWRARIVTALVHLSEVCEETHELPRISRAARLLAAKLRRTWPEDETRLPVHQAWSARLEDPGVP